mmetsp:Transcript_14446/g.49351  ORF Transcript_14446/g.49351 Transcript_14446/m.49351 type:complete len:346 (-) Transcript_14446:2770-3807(-)
MEEAEEERVEDGEVELVVDPSPVAGRGDQGLYRLPRQPLRRHVGPSGRQLIDPLVDYVCCAPKVHLAELVALGPPVRAVAHPPHDDAVDPGEEEVEARAFSRLLLHPLRSRRRHGAQQAGSDPHRRLVHDDSRAEQEALRDLRGELHGEEEAEPGQGVDAVHLLLQLQQPAGGEVDVLEEDPRPLPGGSGRNELLCLLVALGRSHRQRVAGDSEVPRESLDAAAGVEAGRGGEDEGVLVGGAAVEDLAELRGGRGEEVAAEDSLDEETAGCLQAIRPEGMADQNPPPCHVHVNGGVAGPGAGQLLLRMLGGEEGRPGGGVAADEVRQRRELARLAEHGDIGGLLS